MSMNAKNFWRADRMENPCKVQSVTKIVSDNKNGFCVEKTAVTKEFNQIFHKWSEKNRKVELLPLSSLGKKEPKKHIDTSILLKREAIDTYSLKPLTGFFKQRVILDVRPDLSSYYITIGALGNFVMNNLANGSSQPLALKSPLINVKRFPEGRVNLEECRELLNKGYRLFTEMPDGNLVIELSVPKIGFR